MKPTRKAKALDKTLSEIARDTNGYQFTCRYDESVDMAKEILEAKKNCNTFDILCVYTQGQSVAVVRALGAHDEKNKLRIDSLRTYLLEHGWMPSKET
jgi:hypothetical protein